MARLPFPSWSGLSERYGPFPCRAHALSVGEEFFSFIDRSASKRDGEVVLVLRRPDGQVLLHTKPFYPPDTWRLPSGGIEHGESPEAAAQREIREETGLPAHPARLLGVLTYRFRCAGKTVRFASAVFLAETPAAEPAVQDTGERISGYRWVPPPELAQVARRLRRLAPEWRDWGHWRALAHLLAADSLC